MKRLLLFMAWFSMFSGAMADGVNVASVTLPQNSTAEIKIELENPTTIYTGFNLRITLPEGVVPVLDENGLPSFTVGTRLGNSKPESGYNAANNIASFSLMGSGTPISGTSGELFSAIVKVNGDVAVGTVLTAKVSELEFSTSDLTEDVFDDITFTITIGEPVDTRTVLDETSTTAPAAANGVDVRVKRTINAGEWSTICLPFAMSAAQVKTAFGDDVQLADFTGYVFDDEAETITVNFKDATAIQANHPYIIKVSSKVEEFTIDGVDIDPEDEPMVNKGTSRKPKAIIGTYVANTVIENGNLFLSGNQFWYSVGNTKMKAFRAYFNFFDLLPDFEANYAESRIVMNFGDEITGIESLTPNPSPTGEGSIYNLNGQRVEHPAKKGLYIKSGKKVVMK